MIKNLLFTCLVILAGVLITQAQTEKGKFLLGGSTNLAFSSDKYQWDEEDQSEKSTDIDLMPQVGYFIANGLAIGLEFPFSHSWSDDEKSTSIGCGPFAKYYFGKSQFKPFLLTGTEFNKETSKYTYSSGEVSESTDRSFLWKAGGGIGIFITKNLSVDLSLLYVHEEYRWKSETDEPYSKSTSKGLDVEVGFAVIL